MAYDLSKAQLRFTKEQFKATNPTPAADVLCVETDSNVYTTGDGSSAYLSIRGNTTLNGDQRTHADTAYKLMQLSDDRDEVGEAGTIDDGSITNAKLADMATARIKGRATAGTGVPEDLTANQASTILDAATDPFVRTSGLPVSPIPPSWEMTLAAAVTPTTGQVTPNNDTASAVTTLKYYENDRGTVNRSADFALMRIGGIITNEQIAQGDGITQEDAVKFRITGAPTLASNVWTIPVAHVSGVFSGILSFWYVSYAGNEQTQFYNGTAVQLQEAIITGVTDGSGRLAIDMSGAPYAWTNIRAVVYYGEDGASQGSYTTLSANTGRIQFLDPVGDPSGSDIAVTAILKGI